MKEQNYIYTTMEQLHWHDIALLTPIYQANGNNACKVYYRDGSYDNVRNSCATVRGHLAAMHFVNIKEAEHTARQCDTNYRQRGVTVRLGEGCTLVPVICREAKRRNSGTLGYLVLEQLYQYLPTETGHTLLRFHPDHTGVEILQHYDTVKIQLVLARQLTEQIKREQERKQQELQYLQLQNRGRKYIGHHWD